MIPIEAHGIDPMVTREITDELVTALIRSGLAVTDRAHRARYLIRAQVCRPSDGQVRALFRMSDAESGRHVVGISRQDSTPGRTHTSSASRRQYAPLHSQACAGLRQSVCG